MCSEKGRKILRNSFCSAQKHREETHQDPRNISDKLDFSIFFLPGWVSNIKNYNFFSKYAKFKTNFDFFFFKYDIQHSPQSISLLLLFLTQQMDMSNRSYTNPKAVLILITATVWLLGLVLWAAIKTARRWPGCIPCITIRFYKLPHYTTFPLVTSGTLAIIFTWITLIKPVIQWFKAWLYKNWAAALWGRRPLRHWFQAAVRLAFQGRSRSGLFLTQMQRVAWGKKKTITGQVWDLRWD